MPSLETVPEAEEQRQHSGSVTAQPTPSSAAGSSQRAVKEEEGKQEEGPGVQEPPQADGQQQGQGQEEQGQAPPAAVENNGDL